MVQVCAYFRIGSCMVNYLQNGELSIKSDTVAKLCHVLYNTIIVILV